MSDDESVSVSGALRFEEFKKFQIYHTKMFGIIIFLTSFVLFASLLFIMIRTIFFNILFLDLWFVPVLLTLILSLILATLMYSWMRLVIRFRSNREYKSDQQIRSEIIYTFSDDGINQKRSKSNNYYDWADILSIYEYQDMYLLYVSKFKAIILPKRFFKTEEQEKLFKQIIYDNITTQKTKWI